MSDKLRNQINDIIEGEIQLGINEFLEEKQKQETDQGLGFVNSEEAKQLKCTFILLNSISPPEKIE